MQYSHLFDAIREISIRVQSQYAYAKEKFLILQEAKELVRHVEYILPLNMKYSFYFIR
jgi:hypothetical protein